MVDAAVRKKRVPRRGWTLFGVLLLGAAAYGAWKLCISLNREWFPVRFVRVEGGIQNLDVDKLRETLSPAVSAGYFSLDIGEIEGVAKSFAWIQGLQVTRVWPDTLIVGIVEHQPVARWGDKAMLDDRGERFVPDNVDAFKHLPSLYGPPGMEHYLLRIMQQLNDKLAPHGLIVTSLDVSKRRAWTLRLANGLEMHFGRREPLEAMNRFLGLVSKLGENKLPQLLRVDLRYSNGFAVVWRPEPAIEQAPAEPSADFRLLGRTAIAALEKQ